MMLSLVVFSILCVSCRGQMGENHMPPQVLHQFETAEIVLYGKDITHISMCPVVSCMKNPDCMNVTSSTTETPNNSTGMCPLICTSQDEPCDPSSRRNMTFAVHCVLRDSSYHVDPIIEIGEMRRAMEGDTTQFSGLQTAGEMYVFLKRVMHSNGMASYQWSEDLSIPAFYNGTDVDFTGVCGLKECHQYQQGTPSVGVPKPPKFMCTHSCDAGWFRYGQHCYMANTTMMTFTTAKKSCLSYNATMVTLTAMSYRGIRKWLSKSGGYWTMNRANPLKDSVGNQPMAWNQTYMSNIGALPVVITQDGWYTYNVSLTAMNLCVKEASLFMPYMATDKGFIEVTAIPTPVNEYICCVKVNSLKPMTFQGSMMKIIPSAYMENQPMVNLNNTASKFLIVLMEISGRPSAYGDVYHPYIVWMSVMDGDMFMNIWNYSAILPMDWANYVYQMYVYEIESVPNANNYSHHSCPHTSLERCYFDYRQFELDNNLMVKRSYSWMVSPDFTTARNLFAMRKSTNASTICMKLYKGRNAKYDSFSGLLLCNPPTEGGTFVKASVVLCFSLITLIKLLI